MLVRRIGDRSRYSTLLRSNIKLSTVRVLPTYGVRCTVLVLPKSNKQTSQAPGEQNGLACLGDALFMLLLLTIVVQYSAVLVQYSIEWTVRSTTNSICTRYDRCKKVRKTNTCYAQYNGCTHKHPRIQDLSRELWNYSTSNLIGSISWISQYKKVVSVSLGTTVPPFRLLARWWKNNNNNGDHNHHHHRNGRGDSRSCR